MLLRTRPFAMIARLAARKVAGPADAARSTAVATDVQWAVTSAARRIPWRAACFDQGLAAQLMLQRRKIPSRLYYGARSDDSRGPAAHVWVSVEGRVIVGGEGAERFAVLAVYPPDGAVGEGKGERPCGL